MPKRQSFSFAKTLVKITKNKYTPLTKITLPRPDLPKLFCQAWRVIIEAIKHCTYFNASRINQLNCFCNLQLISWAMCTNPVFCLVWRSWRFGRRQKAKKNYLHRSTASSKRNTVQSREIYYIAELHSRTKTRYHSLSYDGIENSTRPTDFEISNSGNAR